MTNHFWRNKKVFITGHTGFKGSWLAFHLAKLGAEVVGYSLPPVTQPSLFDIISAAINIKSFQGDVRDYSIFKKILVTEQPEIIFHLAAQSLVRPSYLDPRETYSINLMGTVNLLEIVRSLDTVRAIVVVTSDKCYDNKESDIAYRENDPLGGYDPYSSSKGCQELITAAFRSSFFSSGKSNTLLASARAGNVIGGGDWSVDRLIPDFIRAIMKNESVEIRHLHAVRPWQHVLEPISGYMQLAEALYSGNSEFAAAWNFGPETTEAQSVEWILQCFKKNWPGNFKWHLAKECNLHEAKLLQLDVSKAKQQLKWYPRWTLKEAITHTIDWYHTYINNEDIASLMDRQISDYANSCHLNISATEGWKQ